MIFDLFKHLVGTIPNGHHAQISLEPPSEPPSGEEDPFPQDQIQLCSCENWLCHHPVQNTMILRWNINNVHYIGSSCECAMIVEDVVEYRYGVWCQMWAYYIQRTCLSFGNIYRHSHANALGVSYVRAIVSSLVPRVINSIK